MPYIFGAYILDVQRDELHDAAGVVQLDRQVFAVLAPEAQKPLESDLAAVADSVGKGDRGAAGAAAGRLVAALTQQAPKIAGRDLDQATTKKLLVAVSGDADAASASGIRGAVQVAMALDRLYAAYSASPGQKPAKPVSDALDRLFGLIEDPAKYDAAKFTAGMKAFRQAVE